MEKGLKDIRDKAKENARKFGELSQYSISCKTLLMILEKLDNTELILAEARKVIEPLEEHPLNPA